MNLFRRPPKGMTLCSPDEAKWLKTLTDCLHQELRDVVLSDFQSLDKVVRDKRQILFRIRGGTQCRKAYFAEQLGTVPISGAKTRAFPGSCVELSLIANDYYAISFPNEVAAMVPTTPLECRAYLKPPKPVEKVNVDFPEFATSEYHGEARGVRLGPEFLDEFNWRTSGQLSILAAKLSEHDLISSDLFGYYGLTPFVFVMPIYDRVYWVIADVGDLLRYVFLDILELHKGLQVRHYDEETAQVFGNSLGEAMSVLFADQDPIFLDFK